MAGAKLPIPTDEQLVSAEKALGELMKKEKPLTAIEKIWKTLGGKIKAARSNGHTWGEIAEALAAGGVVISAAALRQAEPQAQRKPRTKKVDKQ